MPDYDVAIIGAGPGGYVAAIRATQLGLKTALIEKEQVGGLCLNWGCIPSKALLHCADLLSSFGDASALGISFDNLTADLGAAVDHSREIVEKVVGGVQTLLKQNGVEVIHGTARLTGPNTVVIAPEDRSLEVANLIVATGAKARSLPGLAVDGERVLTSREALALREKPQSLIVIGGGPIGVEFAYFYASYGVEVTILEMAPRLLPLEDDDVGRQLRRSFGAKGITVKTGTTVESVNVGDAGVTVTARTGDDLEELSAERVLVGVGFSPNTDGLGLESAGVELDRGWIKIDDFGATNVPSVYAIGDVTGRMLLAHVASHQGVTAVEKIAGLQPQPLNYDQMPRAVYCQPQVGAVGLTEAQARERGYNVNARRFPLGALGKATAIGATDGFVKLVVDESTGAILGCHIVGENATEVLGIGSLALSMEATTEELSALVLAHPTLSEAVKEASLLAEGKGLHFYSSRRA